MKFQRSSRIIALIFITSVLDGGWLVNAKPRPLYPRYRDRVPIAQEAGQATGLVWKCPENVVSMGIRSPEGPAFCESLWTLIHFP